MVHEMGVYRLDGTWLQVLWALLVRGLLVLVVNIELLIIGNARGPLGQRAYVLLLKFKIHFYIYEII